MYFEDSIEGCKRDHWVLVWNVIDIIRFGVEDIRVFLVLGNRFIDRETPGYTCIPGNPFSV